MTDQWVPPPLPIPPDEFVGRDQEIDAAIQLLTSAAVRLLTLVGPGGVGKTRLALRIAAESADLFPDGVTFVSLADLWDADLLLSSIARALGIRGGVGVTSISSVIHERLARRRMLLILDNVEQLLPALATHLSALLVSYPDITVLTTSRVLVRVRGEHAFPVLPLDVPPGSQHDLDSIERAASVKLLLARGQALRPDLRLTTENAHEIAALCRHLDGLPLALELAAAWFRIFSPEALLSRLEWRLPLLVGGPGDQPQRHNTMRAAIAWSYDLLGSAEQRLFRRLSVFAGGWTFEIAELVATSLESASLDVLAGVTVLCDASLVQRLDVAGGEPRFVMLETIREYAREQLEMAQEERDVIRRAHAAHFLAMADRASRDLLGPAHGASFDRLEMEHDNLRAALAWSLDHEPSWALQLAASLSAFWGNRGHMEEGERWYERVLARGADASSSARAAALIGSAWLAWSRGDNDRAERAAAAGLALTVPDSGRNGSELLALYLLGRIAGSQGRWDIAAVRLSDALTRSRAAGNAFGESIMLHHLGVARYRSGDLHHAEALLREAIALNRRLELPRGIAWTLNSLSLVVRAQGNGSQARDLYRESLGILGDNDETYAAIPLAGLARFAAETGRFTAAAQVAGAVAERRDRIGAPIWEYAGPDIKRALELASAGLGDDFEPVRAMGAGRSLAETIVAALAIPDLQPTQPRARSGPDELTSRERDVLVLLAAGSSNQAIADQLGIRLVTAKTHVANILAKFGVATRSAAINYAIRHGVIDL